MQVKKLVGKGGDFEGYTAVFQGDNAGPHNDGEFKKYVEGYCRTQKWLWSPQAAQMPHGNVLDLVVFPAASKRHSRLLREWRGKHSVARYHTVLFYF